MSSSGIIHALEGVLVEHARDVKTEALDELFESSLAYAIDTALSAAFVKPFREASNGSSAIRSLVAALATLGRSEVASALGEAFEVLRGQRLARARGGKVHLESSPERRSNGVYYTPRELAEAMAMPAMEHALKNVRTLKDLKQVRVLDPAAGCGAFLLASMQAIVSILQCRDGFKTIPEEELRKHVAANCIFGVDIDPVAIAITRALILGETGNAKWNGAELDRHLKVGDAVSVPLIAWRKWFPAAGKGGFAVVITNPPWSKLRPLRHEFFEHIDAKVRSVQGTQLGSYLRTHLRDLVDGAWSDYARRTLSLSENLRSSHEYEINSNSSGDADLYKYFTERVLRLLGEGGTAALLLPSGVLRAQGSSSLRRMLRTEGRIQELTEYINRRKLFDIHSMYRFCCLRFIKGRPGGIEKACFGRLAVNEECRPVRLTKEYLAKVGGTDALIPEVRTEEERDLLLRLYQLFPTAGTSGSQWKFGFRRELDMTNDSAHFIDAADARARKSRASERFLPLYEGRMVHQFDCTAKAYSAGHGRSAVWRAAPPNSPVPSPHFYVTEEFALKKGWRGTARAGYCEISGHANERTILACLVPDTAICGNKVPVLKLEKDDISTHLLWIALANSLVVDWMMRRWVSTTVNQFYWQNIPLPPQDNARVNRLLIDATSLLHEGIAGRITNAALGQRALLRALIDAAILDMYRFTDKEVDVLLDDFPQFANAYRRGPTASLPIKTLLAKARRALKKGPIDLTGDLERQVGCSGELAAAAYAPKGLLPLAGNDTSVERTTVAI